MIQILSIQVPMLENVLKMIVKVAKAEAYVLEDKKGHLITYEVDGFEYYAAEIEYHLGEILEKPTNYQ